MRPMARLGTKPADRTATRLGRLELWLLDASETEMEDLWEALKSTVRRALGRRTSRPQGDEGAPAPVS